MDGYQVEIGRKGNLMTTNPTRFRGLLTIGRWLLSVAPPAARSSGSSVITLPPMPPNSLLAARL